MCHCVRRDATPRQDAGDTRETPAVRCKSPRVDAIYRYPVKGLSPESLVRTSLLAGQPVIGDRIYAIGKDPSTFNAQAPSHLPKTKFLMLMQHRRLAALRTRFNETSHVLNVS